MKTKIISIGLVSVILLVLISCQKESLKEPQNDVVAMNNAESSERGWPIIFGYYVIKDIIGTLSQGQAENVTYHENGNLAGYSCKGIGTCHIAGMSNDGIPFSTIESLYIGDETFERFELVKTKDGDILFGTGLDNPTRRVVFSDDNTFRLSIPFIIDETDILSRLNLSEAIEIYGDYQVHEDRSIGEGVQYIKLN